MAFIEESVNEHGTPISKHRCDACGGEYTVCPPALADGALATNCTAPSCKSYDPAIDVDLMFDGNVRPIGGIYRGDGVRVVPVSSTDECATALRQERDGKIHTVNRDEEE